MTRLLVICAPGMDWEGFEARARAGEIPSLAALRSKGNGGWLSGASPGFGPAAAATIVTGVQPERHGIWRNEEAWAGGLRPVGKASWRAQPLWVRLEAAGISTGSIGWPATRPGDAWPGLQVDDSFLDASGAEAGGWALPLHCAPANRREALRDRRVHPSQITAAMLSPLLPPKTLQNRAHDDAVQALRVGMARAATAQSAAVWLLAESAEPAPDAVFLHQPILEHARRAFDASAEPAFANVVPGAWRFLDGLIGRLAEVAGPDCLTMVISPGWGDAPGVFLASGGAGRKSAPEGADLLDITPTILGFFGLEDVSLPGARQAWIGAAAPLHPAPAPRLLRELMADPSVMAPLRRLGYTPPASAPRSWRARGLADLGSITLARDPAGALRLADAALALDPNAILALRVKVRAHVALREPDPLEVLADRLLRLAPERGWGALAHGARYILRGEVKDAASWLTKAEADSDVGALLTVGTLWVAAGRIASAARVFAKVARLDPGNVTAEIGLAMAAAARRDFRAAEEGLNRARRREPGRPAIWLQLAQIHAVTGRKSDAGRLAETAGRLGASPDLVAAAAAGHLRG